MAITNAEIAGMLSELRGEFRSFSASVATELQNARGDRKALYDKVDELRGRMIRVEHQVETVEGTCDGLKATVGSLESLPGAVANLEALKPTVDKLEGLRLQGAGLWFFIAAAVVAAVSALATILMRKIFGVE